MLKRATVVSMKKKTRVGGYTAHTPQDEYTASTQLYREIAPSRFVEARDMCFCGTKFAGYYADLLG